ncbi:hypothetical protein ACHAXN_003672 [Cyclotella atomus]
MKSITAAISILILSVAAVEQPDRAAAAIDHVESITEINDLHHHLPTTSSSSNRRIQSGPNAGKRMAAWRKVHNDARKKYHVEYGGSFTPIKFNMALKRDAEAWAKELVKDCNNRLPSSEFNEDGHGVNSAMRTGSRGFQSPNAVMKMWENKLKDGYPKNGAMTQVLWSKTGHVGCADASSAIGAEKTCTASVCFYAKAGNCAFGRFGGKGNWTQAVLYGPACSTACPSNLETC